jgi:uncharacterized protein (TIGR03083 family)
MGSYERYAEAYRQSIEASIAIGDELTDTEWAAPTECPLWTVGDIYAHLAGAERWMVGDHTTTAPPGGFGEWVDAAVLARRGKSRTDVLDELREVYAERAAQLAESADPQAPAIYPWGVPTTLERLLAVRAFDCWVHEQDIRRAVGRPGNLGSPGAEVTATSILDSLPRIVAKAAAAPPGSAVRLVVTGEVPLDVTVRVDDRGRGAVVPSDGGPPTTELQLTWEAFSRLACGRGDRADHAVRITGDRDLGERVLAHVAVTP